MLYQDKVDSPVYVHHRDDGLIEFGNSTSFSKTGKGFLQNIGVNGLGDENESAQRQDKERKEITMKKNPELNLDFLSASVTRQV